MPLFEVSRSFAPELFSHTAALRTQEYFVSFKDEKQGVGKRSTQNQILSYGTPPKGRLCPRAGAYKWIMDSPRVWKNGKKEQEISAKSEVLLDIPK